MVQQRHLADTPMRIPSTRMVRRRGAPNCLNGAIFSAPGSVALKIAPSSGEGGLDPLGGGEGRRGDEQQSDQLGDVRDVSHGSAPTGGTIAVGEGREGGGESRSEGVN